MRAPLTHDPLRSQQLKAVGHLNYIRCALCVLMVIGVRFAHAEPSEASERPKVRRSLRLTKESQGQRVKILAQDGDKEALLSALPALGQCVGIALGFDRLVMLLLNQTQLSAVLPQPWLGD